MTLLIADADLDARRPVAAGGLRELGESLAADLRKPMALPLLIPEQKALLSRTGGRCRDDGTMLEFDPYSPHDHRCPRCGVVYHGELHHRFWIYWYQLWLAERAVHAALLGRLGIVPQASAFAARILDSYADAYPRYPNVDNALGPTRPFFSTYLESIWLLQLSIAASFLDPSVHRATLDRFAGHVIEPSLELIESFDEGPSNRQVWNNAAMMAGHLALGRQAQAEKILWTQSGLAYHLGTSLLDDGTWYEGENYHLFAHRGLWYGVRLAEAAGLELPETLLSRYQRGFITPFLTSLPDLTFPSRRDSQYAISLRQWRFAEWCELGLARSSDRILAGMLARLYEDGVPRADTGRWKNSAEAERNLPPTQLSRRDLGWKSLLFAREESPARAGGGLPSVLLDAQGIGVIRRDAGQVYVALDYGVSGGGHGHPDRLNLLISDGERRILDDMGTGSYVDPSLHWYRSSLAHNAPFLDGRSQDRVEGTLIAFEDRGGAGWMSATAPIARGASAARTVIVMPDYLVDEVRWQSADAHTVDLPLHLPDFDAAFTEAAELTGSQALEDGFRFVREAARVRRLEAGVTHRIPYGSGDLWLASDVSAELWRCVAPGAPGEPPASFALVRGAGSTGCIRWAWSRSASISSAALLPAIVVETREERHEHSRVPHGWNVAIEVAGAKSTIDLEGLNPAAGDEPIQLVDGPVFREVHGTLLRHRDPRHFTLGEAAYRRSEQTWLEAGRPSAEVTIQRDRDYVGLSIVVDAARSFASAGEDNPLDNEPADINGAGVQIYIQAEEHRAGYVVVPVVERHELAMRPIDGWGTGISIEGFWQPQGDGYRVDLRFRPESPAFMLDLIVNEKPEGRERRRGQLVLSGGKGEFVYLRGDRHDQFRLIPFFMRDD